MSGLDLSKAIEAGAAAEAAYCRYELEHGWPAEEYEGQVEAAIRAALPHILEALAGRAEAEVPNRGYVPRMFGGEPFPDISTPGSAARWLRAKAEEARA